MNYSFKRGKNIVICIVIFTMFVMIVTPVQSKTQIVENNNELLNDEIGLSLSQQNDDLFGIQLLGIKFSLEKYLAYMVYQDSSIDESSSKYSLVSDYIDVDSEFIELRIIDMENRIDGVANITVEQWKEKYINETQDYLTYDYENVTSQISFSNVQNSVVYASSTIFLREASTPDYVKVMIETGNKTSLTWSFNHTSLPENLLADFQTVGEKIKENIEFAITSIFAFAVASWGGTLVGKRAKRITGIPEGLSYIVVFFSSWAWTMAVTLFDNFDTALTAFSILIAAAGIIFGAMIWKGDYKRIRTRQYDHVKSIHIFTMYEVYTGTNEKGSYEAVLFDDTNSKHPLWETVRRFFNIHRELILSIRITVKEEFSENNISGVFYEIDSKGINGSGNFELVVTPEYRRYSRKIFDKKTTVKGVEDALEKSETQKNDVMSNFEVEVSRRVTLVLEAHYAKMGINLSQTKAISDETFKVAANLTGLSPDQVKKAVKDEVADYDKNGKLPTKASKYLTRFRK